MHTFVATIFRGWEIVLILAVVLLLFGSKKLPELVKGLGQGIKEFKKATRDVTEQMERAIHTGDDEGVDGLAGEAGKSLGGIYGKPAFQALTTDNHCAELYNPPIEKPGSLGKSPFPLWQRRMIAAVGRFVRRIIFAVWMRR